MNPTILNIHARFGTGRMNILHHLVTTVSHSSGSVCFLSETSRLWLSILSLPCYNCMMSIECSHVVRINCNARIFLSLFFCKRYCSILTCHDVDRLATPYYYFVLKIEKHSETALIPRLVHLITYRCNPLSVIIIFLSILMLPHHQPTKCHAATSSTH